MEPVPGPVPPPPAPFNPAAPQTGGRRGCSKPMVVGCLVVLLGGGILALGALYYVATHLPTILSHSFATMERELLAIMPPEVTAEERERLHLAFQSAGTAMAHPDKLDPARLNRVQTELFSVSRKGKSLARADVLKLTEALEGLQPPPPPAPPVPAAPSPPPAPVANPASSSSGGPTA
jgi:hypothetical protein